MMPGFCRIFAIWARWPWNTWRFTVKRSNWPSPTGLTGLYVQRYYKERVRDEVFRALEHKLPLCLMMIDVDNFKSYNDRYGHLVGDRVLKAVAQVLRETVRTVDLVARYGGEEFSVLLLKTPWSGAKIVAERIRQRVEELADHRSQQPTRVTVSIGAAELDASFKEVEAFIDTADQGALSGQSGGEELRPSLETKGDPWIRIYSRLRLGRWEPWLF